MKENIQPEARYHIHPAYTLMPDRHCAFITNSRGIGIFDPPGDIDSNFMQTVSPLHACIFSYWDGKRSYNDTLDAIQQELNIDRQTLESFLLPCFENEEHILMNPKDTTKGNSRHWIPRRFIIRSENGSCRNDLYPPEKFIVPKKDWNINYQRARFPLRLHLMLTNHCVTDCLYCYADKKHQVGQQLPTERWLEIIHEAHENGTLNIDVGGGEVFLYPGIEPILQTLYTLGYNPYLSTKIPLSEAKIESLKAAGMRELQLSIDSWDSKTMEQMLKVPPTYFEQLKRSMKLLEKHGIRVKVKSVITRYNDSVEQVDRLLSNLTLFSNIISISIAPGEYSLYKGAEGFLDYRTSTTQWNEIEAFVSRFQSEYQGTCAIDCQTISTAAEYVASVDEKCKNFISRSRCTGNFTALFILPDGKVGICEELYWEPRFLLGDLNKQSLKEIWESEKAVGLYELSQKDIRSKSTCSFCPQFTACHQGSGVCWKLILEAYGEENWDFPDPRCPYAPPSTKKFYIQ